MTGFRALVLAVCCGVFSSGILAQTEAGTISDLAWLKGCWTSDAGERQTTEYWLKPAGGTMLGVGRTIANDKTIEFEFMRIAREESGEIYFIATPSGQTETRFKLIKSGKGEAVFENPTHDFPQRVIYRLMEDGSLLGRIEGTSKGKLKGIDFPMKRSSCDEL